MDVLSQLQLKLSLEFGAINGATMAAQIQCQDLCWTFDPKKSTIIDHVMQITLPTDITIQVSGKNMSQDTQIDDSGQIIADKFIKIHAMTLDNIPVPTAWIEKKIVLRTQSHGEITSNYFGHNGTCIIELAKPNAFLQILHMNKDLS